MAKKSLQLIHDDKLGTLLDNLGLTQKIKDGKMRCKFCKEKADFDNIHSLFPESGDIRVVCDSIDCIRLLTEFLNSGKLRT